MTKIGVLSDSHNNLSSVEMAAKRIIEVANVDAWIHLGDIASDTRALSKYSDATVYSVRGNCDGLYDASAPIERVIDIDGVKLFITHGNKYDVNNSTMPITYRAMELGCKGAFFGHTHFPHLEKSGEILILNPGSTHRPIGCKYPSCAIVTITNGTVEAEILTF